MASAQNTAIHRNDSRRMTPSFSAGTDDDALVTSRSFQLPVASSKFSSQLQPEVAS
jgi:hypothetical protein